MSLIELNHSLENCRKTLLQYGALSSKTEAQILQKKAVQLAWNVYYGLRRIMPAKGSIRAERMAALKSGRGVHVREAVLRELGIKYQAVSQVSTGEAFYMLRRGKKGRGKEIGVSREVLDPDTGRMINFRAMAVKQEIKIREKGRGFLAHSTPRGAKDLDPNLDRVFRNQYSRHGFVLSNFLLNAGPDEPEKFAQLTWFGAKHGGYESPVEGLSQPQQIVVLMGAIDETTRDMQKYIIDELSKLKDKMGLQ